MLREVFHNTCAEVNNLAGHFYRPGQVHADACMLCRNNHNQRKRPLTNKEEQNRLYPIATSSDLELIKTEKPDAVRCFWSIPDDRLSWRLQRQLQMYLNYQFWKTSDTRCLTNCELLVLALPPSVHAIPCAFGSCATVPQRRVVCLCSVDCWKNVTMSDNTLYLIYKDYDESIKWLEHHNFVKKQRLKASDLDPCVISAQCSNTKRLDECLFL